MYKAVHINKSELLALYSKEQGPFISCYIHEDTQRPNSFFEGLLGISETEVLLMKMGEIILVFREDSHDFVNTHHEDEIDCYMCSYEGGKIISENT